MLSKKNKTRKILYWLTGIAGVLVLTACPGNDDCDDRPYEAIPQQVIEAIPYQDGQIVRFKTNEPAEFSVITRRIFEVIRPDAPVICNEYHEVSLSRTSDGAKFAEFINWGNGFVDSMMQITVFPVNSSGAGGTVQFTVAQDGTMADFLAGEAVFHNTIQIDGQTYNNVIERTYPDAPHPDGIARFFYNKDFGIIQIEAKGGLVITRKQS